MKAPYWNEVSLKISVKNGTRPYNNLYEELGYVRVHARVVCVCVSVFISLVKGW